MKNPKISVVVPFFNEEKVIEKCIKSLINQNYPKKNYELIFVNNNSSDGSVSLVNKHKKIRLINEEMPGPSAARNTGIRVSRGKIIAFIDADSSAKKNWLDVIDKSSKNADFLVGLGQYNFKKRSTLQLINKYERKKYSYIYGNKIEKYYFCTASNLAIKRSVINRIGYFNENLFLGEDIEILHRYINKINSKKRLAFVDKMITKHIEVTNLKNWLNLMSKYGEFNNYPFDYSPLSNQKRIRIFLSFVKEQNLSLRESLLIILYLTIGIYKYDY